MAMRYRKYLTFFAVLPLYLAIGGYRFGTGDHVSQLPTVLHFFNPHLYQTDFRLQMIFPWYVKSGLFISLAWLSRILHIPLEYVFFAVFCLVLWFFLVEVDELLALLGVERQVRTLAILLMLPFSYLFPSISHFHLVTLRLVPYFFVLPFCLKAMCLFIRRRLVAASLLTAFVFYVHQQIGLILFGILFFVLALELFMRKVEFQETLFFLLPFLALFGVHFVAMQMLGSYRGYPWFDHRWGVELLEMVRFRVPHHLLLSYSGWVEYLCFGVSLALALFLSLRLRPDNRAAQVLSKVAVAVLLLCAAGAFFTEVYPLPIAFGLYLFRSDVILRVIGFLAAMVALEALVDSRFVKKANMWLFILGVTVAASVLFLKDNIRIFIPETELVRVSRCIKEKTPQSAFILASPAIKGLRFYSERSVFVSWKSHGLFFPPDIAREWFHRMMLLCSMEEEIPCEGTPCKKLCGKNYDNMKNARLLSIANQYGTDYLLVGTDRDLPFEKVCTSDHFILYRLK